MDAMEIAIIAVVIGALIIGLIANRLYRRRLLGDNEEGPSMSDVLTQALTLAILFMAFILVESSVSFANARGAAIAEADAVDTLYETAGYAAEPNRQNISGKVVCYARAIVAHEWDHMDQGRAPEASVWSSGLRREFKAVYDADEGIFGDLVAADNSRSTSRRERLQVAVPKTPMPVYILILTTVGLSVAGFVFALSTRRHRAQTVAVVVLALLLTASLLLIRDLERPFDGLSKVTSTEMIDTRDDITQDFIDDYGADKLPCDDTGNTR